MENNLKVGSKVVFREEKRPYTVKASGGQFAICTKPYNVKKTVLYTIVDLEGNIRGRNNLVFNMYDYTVQEEIDQCLKDLLSGEIKVSHRHRIRLDIHSVQ